MLKGFDKQYFFLSFDAVKSNGQWTIYNGQLIKVQVFKNIVHCKLSAVHLFFGVKPIFIDY